MLKIPHFCDLMDMASSRKKSTRKFFRRHGPPMAWSWPRATRLARFAYGTQATKQQEIKLYRGAAGCRFCERSGIFMFGLAQLSRNVRWCSNRPYFKNFSKAAKHKKLCETMWSVCLRSSHDLLAEDCFEVPWAAASHGWNPQKLRSKCARHLP